MRNSQSIRFLAGLLLATLVIACPIACDTSVPGESISSKTHWWPRASKTSSGSYLTIIPETGQSFRVRVINQVRSSILIDAYYFGYTVTIKYREGRTAHYNYSDHKVPVPIPSDWHILKSRQALEWVVELPSEFPDLRDAVELSYCNDNVRRMPPSHITEDFESIQPENICATFDWH